MVAETDVTRSETVLYEKRDGVAWVTLNRPERMNALNTELRGAMARALRDASEDEGVYTVIVTGAGGRAFSAGNDLKAVAEAHASGIAPGQEERATDTYDLGDCPKPTIAVVDGLRRGRRYGGHPALRHPHRYGEVRVRDCRR